MVVVAMLVAVVVAGAAPNAYASGNATPVYTATLDGVSVNICSNSGDRGADATDTECGGQENVGGYPGAIWQCVEFAQRLYQDEGWYSGDFPIGEDGVAADIYGVASEMGMSTQANHSITSIVPGDMIIHGFDDEYSPDAGHVAIVYSVKGSAINAVQQNAPDQATYTLSGGTLTGGSGNDILGIVHSPDNHNTDGGASSTYADASSNSGVVVDQSTGFTQAFVEGPDNSLYSYYSTPGVDAWSGPVVVAGDGSAYSNPVAVFDQALGWTEVLVEGPNNSLVAYWSNSIGGGWSPGLTVAGDDSTYSAPAAVLEQSTGYVQAFVQGPSNSLDTYWQVFGDSWGGPSTVAGGSDDTTYSAPSAVIQQSSSLTEVFVEGADNALYQYENTDAADADSSWSGPNSLGGTGTTYSDPAAVFQESSGFAQVFAQGPGNSLNSWWEPGVGETWGGPDAVAGGTSGTTYSDPTVAFQQSSGFTEVYAEGADNALYEYYTTNATDGSTWYGPYVIPSGSTGTTYSSPAVALTTSNNFIQVFAQGPGNSLNTWYQNSGDPFDGPNAVAGGTSDTTYSAP